VQKGRLTQLTHKKNYIFYSKTDQSYKEPLNSNYNYSTQIHFKILLVPITKINENIWKTVFFPNISMIFINDESINIPSFEPSWDLHPKLIEESGKYEHDQVL